MGWYPTSLNVFSLQEISDSKSENQMSQQDIKVKAPASSCAAQPCNRDIPANVGNITQLIMRSTLKIALVLLARIARIERRFIQCIIIAFPHRASKFILRVNFRLNSPVN